MTVLLRCGMADPAACRLEDGDAGDDLVAAFFRMKTIAVVGCSPKPERPSHFVAAYMRSRGHRIVPINPGHREILGETCYKDLRAIPFPVDMVNVFRRPEHVAAVVDDAIAIGAKGIWLQDGVYDAAAEAKARAAGLLVVSDDCLMRRGRQIPK